MDKLTFYRTCVKQLLQKYATYRPAHGEIEVQTIFDNDNEHYQLVMLGWDKGERVYGCTMHLDIKDGKIWIQHNSTDALITRELIAMGVAKEDVVIGFHAPYKRSSNPLAYIDSEIL